MSSRKLSQSERNLVTAELVRQKFEPLEIAIKDQEPRLAKEVYRAAFTEKEWDVLKKIPEGWLQKTTSVRARMGHTSVLLNGADAVDLPHSKWYGNDLIKMDSDQPLAKKVLGWSREKDQIARDKDELTRKIGQTLRSFTTVGALLKAWPEAAKIVRKTIGDDPVTSKALAVPIKQLNAALGLQPVAA